MKKIAASSIFVLVTLLSLAVIAQAQEPKKVPRIGFIAGGSPSTDQHYVDAFRQGLSDLGHVEGKNIAIEWRYAEGKVERAPDLARDLVRLNVAVLVVGTTPTALVAQQATRTIPIVFAVVADPIGVGLVERPG